MQNEIKMFTSKNGRTITINGISVTPIGESGLKLEAKLIENMSPCELSYFRPVIVDFDKIYCQSNRLQSLSDDLSVSFTLIECGTVSTRVIMLTPTDQKHREKIYHAALKKAVRNNSKLLLSKNTEIHFSNLTEEEKKKNAEFKYLTEFTLTFQSDNYKKVFSALNKIIDELKSETKKQIE